MINSADEGFIITTKLTNAGFHLYELGSDNNKDIYVSYRESGAIHLESPRDTHYVMDNDKVVFIGNRSELLGFCNSTL